MPNSTPQPGGKIDYSLALLYLPNPPSPWSAEKWYGRKIVGVPFLLRNLLRLQRAGVKKVMVCSRDEQRFKPEFIRSIEQDNRLDVELEWASALQTASDEQPCRLPDMILNGGALWSGESLTEALESPFQQNGNITDLSIPRERLAAFLREKNFFEDCRSGVLQKAYAKDDAAEDLVSFKIACGEEDFQVRDVGDFDRLSEALLKTSGLSNDSLMDRLATRFASRQLTRMFLKTPLTPNQVTGLSFILGLASACWFYQGNYIAGIVGALALQLSAWVDCVDGEIARLKFMESPLGAQLDIIGDNLVHFAVFFSIGMGAYVATGKAWFILFGALAVVGSMGAFFLIFQDITKSKQRAGHSPLKDNHDSSMAEKIANRDFTYFLLFMAAIDQMGLFIIITAVGSNAFFLFLLIARRKSFIQNAEKARVQ